MPPLQAFSSKRWAEVEEEREHEVQNAFTESVPSNSDTQHGEVYEQGPFMLLHDSAQQLQVAPAIPRTLYPRQSDGVAGLEVAPELAVMLKCLLRCLHVALPFHRLAKQTRVTSDMDRFASRYLPGLYRTFLQCGAIRGVNVLDKAAIAVALDTWLRRMLADNCTRGFHLDGFSLTDAEIYQVSWNALQNFLYVSAV